MITSVPTSVDLAQVIDMDVIHSARIMLGIDQLAGPAWPLRSDLPHAESFEAKPICGGFRKRRELEERFSLWTPECLPILLPNLQRSKYIYRKIGGELSLGFIPRYLFM